MVFEITNNTPVNFADNSSDSNEDYSIWWDREIHEIVIGTALAGVMGWSIGAMCSSGAFRGQTLGGQTPQYTAVMVAACATAYFLSCMAAMDNEDSMGATFALNLVIPLGAHLIASSPNWRSAEVVMSVGGILILGMAFIPVLSEGIVDIYLEPREWDLEPREWDEYLSDDDIGDGGFAPAQRFYPVYPESISVGFDDIAGIDSAKEDVMEVVDFLKNPEKYNEIGAHVPKGILLYGPPGTGKTMIAKATAKEAGVPFYSVSGSQLSGILIGLGAKNIRALFRQAGMDSPCIIFIDEMDSLAPSRDNHNGHQDDIQTVSELLAQMDGFGSDSGIIVMGATNHPSSIDSAVLRPGRFDRQIEISPPNKSGRLAILQVHTRKVLLGENVNLAAIAKVTAGWTGAELANLVNEAAILAVKEGEVEVQQRNLLDAMDKIRFGAIKDRESMKEELRATAYHEAGHALVAMLLKDALPLDRVTIVSRSNYLGVTLFNNEDINQQWKKQYLADMAVSMGGRIAEQIFCGDFSSGASSDLRHAHQVAKYMTRKWGMTEAGPISVDLNMQSDRLEAIEAKLLEDAAETARKILEKHKDIMHLIVEGLLEYETLTKEHLEYIIEHKKLPIADLEEFAA